MPSMAAVLDHALRAADPRYVEMVNSNILDQFTAILNDRTQNTVHYHMPRDSTLALPPTPFISL